MLKSLEGGDPEAPLLRNAVHVHPIGIVPTAPEIRTPQETPPIHERKLIAEDDNTSETVATTASTSSAPVEKEFLPSSIPPPPPLRLEKPSTILDEKHVLHLRSSAIHAISQCYRQVICCSTAPFVLPKLLRNTSHTSSISSHLRTTSYSSLSSNVRNTSHASSVSSSRTPDVGATRNDEAPTFLLVTGPTGSGKSHVVRHALLGIIRETSGYFIRGYWDRLQHPDPYQAYVTAFSDFTAQMLQQRKPGKIRTLRDMIQESCGTESGVLLEMIPALRVIMDYPDNDDDKSPQEEEEENGGARGMNGSHPSPSSATRQTDSSIQRFVFVFQTFLHAISSLEEPVVLVLDNLQWADPCSIELLTRILTDRPPGLFVVGTYDGTDMYPDFSLLDDATSPPTGASYLVQKLFELERSSAGSVRTVSIPSFDYEQVKYLLDQSLQQSSLFDLQVHDDLCQVVMEETQGNLFLMVQFLQWLLERGLLRNQCPQDCGSAFRYWEWKIDDILEAVRDSTSKNSTTSGTKYYVSEKLEQLPAGMIDVLKVGACFGNSHAEAQLMEYVLDFPVTSILSEAVAMGLLVPIESGNGESQTYSFPHDGIQMAAYHMIPENNRELFHLEIGRRLWRRLDKGELDRSIFIILSQMILGRRLITREPERYSIANLCYHAGRKAAKTSNFRVALTYLNFGIELLGDRGWRAEYELSLMMYIAAAEMEVCNANYEGMEVRVKSILENGRSAEDKVQAKTLQIYALGVTDRQQLGLDMGLELLSDLGFPFPRRFCRSSLRKELTFVQKLLKGKSNDYIGRLPIIEDKDVLAALNVLSVVSLRVLGPVLARQI
jgi:predicted ATPase